MENFGTASTSVSTDLSGNNLATTMSSNSSTSQSIGCGFNDTSMFSNEDCAKCFSNEECSSIDCQSVCKMDLCGGQDECENASINDVYKNFFIKFKKYYNSLPEKNIDNIKTIDFQSKGIGRHLWSILTNLYDVNKIHAKSNYIDMKRLNNIVKSQENILEDDGVLLNNLDKLNSTTKRQHEINLNDYRNMRYNINIFKQVVIAVAFAVIIPALVRFGIIDMTLGLVTWVIFMIIIGIYAIFMVYVKNSNRDDIDFKTFNFVKPTEEEIARSRLAGQMSKGDKAKCQALSEMEDDFDKDSINIDINPYISKDNSESKCFNN